MSLFVTRSGSITRKTGTRRRVSNRVDATRRAVLDSTLLMKRTTDEMKAVGRDSAGIRVSDVGEAEAKSSAERNDSKRVETSDAEN